jgi:hypothetical protein
MVVGNHLWPPKLSVQQTMKLVKLVHVLAQLVGDAGQSCRPGLKRLLQLREPPDDRAEPVAKHFHRSSGFVERIFRRMAVARRGILPAPAPVGSGGFHDFTSSVIIYK